MDMPTDKYLEKFRQGEYVWIKHWTEFLCKHYKVTGMLEADQLVNLFVFELINHNISLDDLEAHIPILFAITESPSFALSFAELLFYITSLLLATLQCKVFFQHNLIDSYKYESLEKPNIKTIFKFIARDNESLSLEKNNEALTKLNEELQEKQKDETEAKRIAEAIKILEDKMHVLTPIQGACINYLKRLKQSKEKDEDLPIRIGVAKSLKRYTFNQCILNQENRNEIINFVTKLRELNPYPWEEAYFNYLTGDSFFKRFYQSCMSGLANLRFFTLKQFNVLTSAPENPPQLK